MYIFLLNSHSHPNDLKVPDPSLAASWIGGIPGIKYRIGGTDSCMVRLNVQMTEPKQRIWNVVGRIDGGDDDAPVILGNHRDAWTYGAAGL